MNNKKSHFSDNEQDLLAELFNLGVGQAANSLSELVNQEVLLSVPSVRFANSQTVTQEFGSTNGVFSVTQALDGYISMQSILIFRPEESFEVVKQMLDSQLSDEAITELQNEALTEIGNIVLNACIAVISDTIGHSFDVQLPLFRDVNARELLDDIIDPTEDIILFIEVKLELKTNKATGYLVFILNTHSMENLHQTLRHTLKNLGA